MAIIDVKGTEVLGVVAPRIAELTSRPCTIEELQAALVQLIGVVNENAKTQRDLALVLSQKQDRDIVFTL